MFGLKLNQVQGEPLWTARVTCNGCGKVVKVLTIKTHQAIRCLKREQLTISEISSGAELHRTAMRLYMRNRSLHPKDHGSGLAHGITKPSLRGKAKSAKGPSVIAALESQSAKASGTGRNGYTSQKLK